MKFTSTAPNYQRLLFEKMQDELTKFCASLTKQSPEVLIKSAYEIAVKDEILLLFDENEDVDLITNEQMHTLCKKDYPLDELYNAWLKADCTIREMLMNAIKSYCDWHYPTPHYQLNTKCHFERDISDTSYEHDLLMHEEYPKTMVQYVRGIICESDWYSDVFTVHHKKVTDENGFELMSVFHFITQTYLPSFNRLMKYCSRRESEKCTEDKTNYWFYTESKGYNYSVRIVAAKGDYNLYIYQYKK